MKDIKKGDSVLLQDGGMQRTAVVVKNGLDSQDRIRVRPSGISLDMSITIHPNQRVYVIKKLYN